MVEAWESDIEGKISSTIPGIPRKIKSVRGLILAPRMGGITIFWLKTNF